MSTRAAAIVPRPRSSPALQDEEEEEETWIVAEFVGERTASAGRVSQRQLLVRWEGSDETSWEPEGSLRKQIGDSNFDALEKKRREAAAPPPPGADTAAAPAAKRPRAGGGSKRRAPASSCKSCKGGCTSGRCACFKDKRGCTGACGCSGCANSFGRRGGGGGAAGDGDAMDDDAEAAPAAPPAVQRKAPLVSITAAYGDMTSVVSSRGEIVLFVPSTCKVRRARARSLAPAADVAANRSRRSTHSPCCSRPRRRATATAAACGGCGCASRRPLAKPNRPALPPPLRRRKTCRRWWSTCRQRRRHRSRSTGRRAL